MRYSYSTALYYTLLTEPKFKSMNNTWPRKARVPSCTSQVGPSRYFIVHPIIPCVWYDNICTNADRKMQLSSIQVLLKSETEVHEAQGIVHNALVHGQKRIFLHCYYTVNYLTYF